MNIVDMMSPTSPGHCLQPARCHLHCTTSALRHGLPATEMFHVNPIFRLPLVCVVLGTLCLTTGLFMLSVLHGMKRLDTHSPHRSLTIPLLCGVGGAMLMVGGCACCTIQQRIHRNWAECKRKQSAHRILLGSPSNPGSQAQPILSGYDPRMTPM